MAIFIKIIIRLKNKILELRRFLTPRNTVIGLAVLLLISLFGTFYFYRQVSNDPAKLAKDDLNNTIMAVGKILVLPQNETPSLATVSDPSKLKDQPFFAAAESGDKVLVYSLAKKAILYSPKLNKIVEVAPINLGQSAGGAR